LTNQLSTLGLVMTMADPGHPAEFDAAGAESKFGAVHIIFDPVADVLNGYRHIKAFRVRPMKRIQPAVVLS
jgi:hypothetical protein